MEEGNGIKHWPGKIRTISISSDYMGEGISGGGVANVHQGLGEGWHGL